MSKKRKKKKKFWVQFKWGNIWALCISLGDISPQNIMDVVKWLIHCPLSDCLSLTLCYPTTHPLLYYWRKKKHGVNWWIWNSFCFHNHATVDLCVALVCVARIGGTRPCLKTRQEREDSAKRVREHALILSVSLFIRSADSVARLHPQSPQTTTLVTCQRAFKYWNVLDLFCRTPGKFLN